MKEYVIGKEREITYTVYLSLLVDMRYTHKEQYNLRAGGRAWLFPCGEDVRTLCGRRYRTRPFK